MDLEQLETFVQVAELGSFTRASNANAMHAVLSLIALPADAAAGFHVRPIGTPPLAATLWIATSAERPHRRPAGTGGRAGRRPHAQRVGHAETR